jgi:hypothetical protein
MWFVIIAAFLSLLALLFLGVREGTTSAFSAFCYWFIWTFHIVLITGGLFVTLSDKKDKKPKDD